MRISRTPFPPADAKTLPLLKFCDYANALRELPVAKYARLYVRRWKPILLPEEKQDEVTGLKREGFPSEEILTITKDDVPLSERRIMEKVGVGDYTIRLNDNRLPFERATVVHCEKWATPRDYDLYPPLLDISRLDWNEDDNQSYIKWGLSRGIFKRPGQIDKDQSDMANVAAIDSVLADARKERDRADQIQRERLERAEREAADAKAREEAAKAKAEAAAAKVEEAKPATPASDLLSVVTSVASLAKSLQAPKDDSLSEYLKLQAEREKTEREREKEERQAAREAAAAERKRADDLQQQVLDDARAAVKLAAQPVAPPAPKTDVDLLEEMVKKQSLMKQLTGRGGSQEEESRPSNIDKWLEAAPLIAPVVQSIVGGVFQTIQYGFQTWQQISYNAALAKGGAVPQPPTVQQQPAAQPGQPAQAQAPPPTPEQQQAHQRLINMLKALEDNSLPILIAFSKGESGDSVTAGATAAEALIGYKGRPDYDQIRSLGEKQPGVFDLEVFIGNIKFLLGHPGRGPNTAHLANTVGPKPSFPQFLAGFFNYDQIQAEMQRAEEERLRQEDER